jgi:arylsulfatase A-like enzyme
LAAFTGSLESAPDSQNLLDTFLGKSKKGRDAFVLEAYTKTALRAGDWVMIPPYPGPAVEKNVNIELGNLLGYQLFNLKDDPGQQKNLASSNPEKLEEMKKIYQEIRGSGSRIEQLELK